MRLQRAQLIPPDYNPVTDTPGACSVAFNPSSTDETCWAQAVAAGSGTQPGLMEGLGMGSLDSSRPWMSTCPQLRCHWAVPWDRGQQGGAAGLGNPKAHAGAQATLAKGRTETKLYNC